MTEVTDEMVEKFMEAFEISSRHASLKERVASGLRGAMLTASPSTPDDRIWANVVCKPPTQVLVDRKWLEATQCPNPNCKDSPINPDKWGQEQCQWCDEKAQFLGSDSDD